MEVPEAIKVINKRLIDYFGVFENGEANFRVIWSDDEIEKRLISESPEGFQFLTPVLSNVPKYSYIKQRYILERIVPVPYSAASELLGRKLSYEPIWVFEDAQQNALPPVWEAINILVRTLLDQQTYSKGPYKIPEGEGNTTEEIERRVDKLQEVLFGNETSVGDALAYGSGVGYGNYIRDDTRNNNNPIKIH